MLQGIDVNQRIEFVSKYDTTEPKTVFQFKPLSGSEMFGLQGKQDSFIMTVLNLSIVKIDNLPKGKDKKEFLNCLPSNVLNELFTKFNELNNISEEEEKN